MRLIRSLDNLPAEARHVAVAIGNFDGVHLGHARIATGLVQRARQLQRPAVIFTFDPPPARVLRPQAAPPPLSTLERKVDLLAELGVDVILAYPTDAEFLSHSAAEFFHGILRERLQAAAIVEGTNFFFGHGREGGIELLGRFCREAGVELDVVQPYEVDGRPVSSSRIRALVAQGEVREAVAMLTRPYRVRGTVVRGAGRGAKLGYPTANLEDVATLLPGEGIYAGRGWLDAEAWPAAISIGPNPTFDEGLAKVEAFLIGFRGDLYGQALELEFLTRLRGVQRFESPEQLVSQMNEDVVATRQIAAIEPAEVPSAASS